MEKFPLGGILTLLVLLPNILIIFFPPMVRFTKNTRLENKHLNLMTWIERVGQMGCFVLPFFYHLNVRGTVDMVWLSMMFVTMAIYYAGWVRYLLLGRKEELLYRSMLGIPLPMAVMPVLYFLLAAAWLNSTWLLVSALILGVGHLTVSWQNSRKPAGIYNV